MIQKMLPISTGGSPEPTKKIVELILPYLTADNAKVLKGSEEPSTTLGGYGWNAFDGNPATQWDNYPNTQAALPNTWVGYNFGKATYVDHVIVKAPATGGCTLKNYVIEGSNDNFASDVHVVGSGTCPSDGNASENETSCVTVAPYSSYRMRATGENYRNNYDIACNALKFFGYYEQTPTPTPITIEQFVLCPATEYAKANIIATSYASGYLPEYAFNDAANNGWNCNTPDYNKTNCYIGYDFGTPVAVIGAYYYGPTNYAHGWHYKLWGRNDAADEWTELSTEYTTQAGYISSNSLEKYRYIALNCYVDGTGAGYAAVQILKFYGFR